MLAALSMDLQVRRETIFAWQRNRDLLVAWPTEHLFSEGGYPH
jgi:hypothetical protein